MKKIAVTGPLSSGKSTVCQILGKVSRVYIVDADQLVSELYADPKIQEEIAEIYNKKFNPKTSITPFEINKQFIASHIFDHPEMLKALESVLHPWVEKKMEEHYQVAKKTQSYDFFVVEIPLLYEVGWDEKFDAVILVNTDEALCKKRFKEKTGKNEEEYRKRAQRFLPMQEKMNKKPFIVSNNGSLKSIEKQLQSIIDTIHISGE